MSANDAILVIFKNLIAHLKKRLQNFDFLQIILENISNHCRFARHSASQFSFKTQICSKFFQFMQINELYIYFFLQLRDLIIMGCLGAPVASSLNLGNYSISKQAKLGEGAYGDIWKCTVLSSKGYYALKQIRLQTSQLEKMYTKEVRLLKKLAESKAKGSIILKQSGIVTADRKKIGVMLMELGTINLLDYLMKNTLTQSQILSILRDVCQSLEEIHSLGIYHLDLKPQNLILVDKRFKICDFGSAIDTPVDFDQMERKKVDSIMEYLEANSTLIYRSPEMIDPLGKVIGAASDIWMLGCIAYLLAFRKHPFEGQGKLAIISGNTKYPDQGFITELIRTMLVLQFKARPCAKEVKIKIESKLNSR